MSFTVKLWSFSKKVNSTAQPSTTGDEYNCTVKNGTRINRPIIEFNLGFTTDPSEYNYVYIAAFGRYYFIDEWSFDRGLWTASMHTDVLATFKTQIGNSTLYVLRAAGANDGRIVDNLYPCKTECSFNRTTITSPYKPYFDTTFQGCYVIGVVQDGGLFGSLNYFVVDTTAISNICDYLINDAVSVANNFNLSDASLALQNSIVDPIQYIKSCVWLPFSASDVAESASLMNIFVYNWQIPNTQGYPIINPAFTKTISVNTKKHPDAASRGVYLNSSPYTIATLAFPPFGVIEMDTSILCNANNISLDLTVDKISGKGVLTVKCNNTVLNRLDTQLGVPIQLSQIASDYIGAVTSAVSGVGGAVGNFLSGNIAGGITSALSGVGNAINSLAPRVESLGGGGGFSHLYGSCELDFQFFRPVEDDNTHHGRPLCQNKQINTLSGYMLIQDGDIGTVGFVEENQEIKSILETGFYYE